MLFTHSLPKWSSLPVKDELYSKYSSMKSEFQDTFTTPGSSSHTRHRFSFFFFIIQISFPQWNVVAGKKFCFQPSLSSGRVRIVWGVSGIKVKWLVFNKARKKINSWKSSLGGSLKIFLFRESTWLCAVRWQRHFYTLLFYWVQTSRIFSSSWLFVVCCRSMNLVENLSFLTACSYH